MQSDSIVTICISSWDLSSTWKIFKLTQIKVTLCSVQTCEVWQMSSIHYYSIIENNFTVLKILYSLSLHHPSPTTVHHWSFYCLYIFVSSKKLYNCNCIICRFLILACFTYQYAFKLFFTYFHALIDALLLNNILLYGVTQVSNAVGERSLSIFVSVCSSYLSRNLPLSSMIFICGHRVVYDYPYFHFDVHEISGDDIFSGLIVFSLSPPLFLLG